MRRPPLLAILALIPVLFAMVNVPRISWRQRAPLPTPLAGGYSAAAGKTVIYAGGTNWNGGVKHWLRDVHLYDVHADQWRAGPALPVPLAYGAVCSLKNGIEIYGGTDGKGVYRDCWRFTLTGNTWEKNGTLGFDTLLSSAMNIVGRVYLFGGCSDVSDLTTCTDAVHVRERDGSWRKITSIPGGPVAQAADAALGNRVYLFGGCSMAVAGKQVNHQEAYCVDLRSMEWRRIRSLPKPNSGPTALPLNDRFILVAGGYTASMEEAAGKPANFGFSSDAMIYDSVKDDYFPVDALPVPLSGVDLLKIGNIILGVGGEDRMRGRTAGVFAGELVW